MLQSIKEIATIEKKCMDFLPKVSRTFAISINKLPKKQRKVILVSYLFCRILDTIEDSSGVSIPLRAKMLLNFKKSFVDKKYLKPFLKSCQSLKGIEDHLKLCLDFPQVLVLFDSFSSLDKNIIQKWVFVMADGMKKFIEKYPKGLRIKTLEEYHDYCFIVAGTVGHLLTDYWNSLYHFKNYGELNDASKKFAIALQSINIIKDIQSDLHIENNIYLPKAYFEQYETSIQKFITLEKNNSFPIMENWLSYCKENLTFSLEKYFFQLPFFCFSVKLFCIVPLLFAFATWHKINNFYQQNGYIADNIKISRKSVKKLFLFSRLCIFSNFFTKKIIKDIFQNKYIDD